MEIFFLIFMGYIFGCIVTTYSTKCDNQFMIQKKVVKCQRHYGHRGKHHNGMCYWE